MNGNNAEIIKFTQRPSSSVIWYFFLCIVPVYTRSKIIIINDTVLQ